MHGISLLMHRCSESVSPELARLVATSVFTSATCMYFQAALQRELGLPVEPSAPLLGFIGRLDYQKGIDLIRDSYDWLMSEGCQLVLLGR